MPQNKKPLQSPKTTPLYRRKSVWIAALLLVIAAAPAVWHVHDQRAVAADRARFQLADKDMRTLSSRVSEDFLPIQKHESHVCDRISNEFEQKPIFCSMSFVDVYKVPDYVYANTLTKGIEQEIKQDSTFDFAGQGQKNIGGQNEGPFVPLKTPEDNETVSTLYTHANTGIHCQSSYQFFPLENPPESYKHFITGEGLSVIWTYSCGGVAKASYF